MFKKIDHVEVVTNEPERSTEFYTSVLGFRVKLRQEVPLPGGPSQPTGSLCIVYLELGGTGVELLTYRGPAVEPLDRKLRVGYRLVCLEVSDMAAALEYLKTKGVDTVWGPVDIKEYIRAEIRDPDGNHIELRQWR